MHYTFSRPQVDIHPVSGMGGETWFVEFENRFYGNIHRLSDGWHWSHYRMSVGPFETVEQAIDRAYAFFAGRGLEESDKADTYTVRMCGRYAIAPARGEAWAAMGELLGPGIEAMLAALEPRFNVAPSTQIPIVVQNPKTREIKALLARWGFIPHWWKETTPPKFSTINARSEEAASKPLWREAYLHRRCLIAATHWYEWKQIDPKTKQPYALQLKDGEAFMFAGLYSHWIPPGSDESIYTAAILTRDASPSVRDVHDRMPVILHPGIWRDWLDPATNDKGAINDILVNHAILEAKGYKISAKVNSPKNQGPEILNPTE